MKAVINEDLSIFIPARILATMGWERGTTLRLEPIVNRDGTISHLVVEKV